MTDEKPLNLLYTGDPLLMDPTFVPQEDVQAPHDVMHALAGLEAMQDPYDGDLPENEIEGSPKDIQQDNTMSDNELLSLIKKKVEASHQWYGSGKLSSKRIDADRYYRGEPLGNEQEGRSQVVSRDVAEAIDGAMPSLMRVFAGGEQVCIFEPHGPEDEEASKQATDYINHIFMNENEGFMILYTWFKDSLLKKNGIVKAWYESRFKRTREFYQGLTEPQFQILKTNHEIQITDVKQYDCAVEQIDPATGQPAQMQVPMFDCTVVTLKPEKRVRIENVAPDEFIIERRAVSINKAGFLAHRGKRTISDLIECGYDRDVVMSIPRGDDNDYTRERIERFSDEDQLPYGSDDESDPTTRKVWITDAYVLCDYDGDGIAEWRHVVIAGDATQGTKILSNDEVDDHPFADLTPDPEPHKFYGQSLFDKTKDIQDIKTALIRGILDSTYLANSPRMGAVDGQVNLDDLLDSRPGGVVRIKRSDALVPIRNAPVSAEAMQVISYIDTVKEKRTGISNMAGGVNADVLKSTALGADIMNTASQSRLELMCRLYAESGIKRLFRIMFRLTCQYQDVARMVRLRNKWVEVNPRDWKDRMDVSATVGIGLGSKAQQAAIAQQLLQVDQQIIKMQGGVKGPLVSLENVYNKLAKLVEAVGWKTPDPYYSDPKNWQEPPPPQPTPEQQVHMQELQSKATQAQANADSAKASALANIQTKQLDYEMRKLDVAIKTMELEALRLTSAQDIAERANNKTNESYLGA